MNKLLNPLKKTLTKNNISDAAISDDYCKIKWHFHNNKHERWTHQQHIL